MPSLPVASVVIVGPSAFFELKNDALKRLPGILIRFADGKVRLDIVGNNDL